MYIKTSKQKKVDMGFGNYYCNWGLHICGLYQNEKERDEIIMGYLHKGDIEGDLQLYSPAERTKENFVNEYSRRYPCCAGHLDDESKFQIISPEDLYYPEGKFSPISMDESLSSFYKNSQINGKRYVRATAEMSWSLEKIPGIEHFMAYESRLNYFIPGKPWISICLYNVNKFSGAQIMNALRTHPYTISGGIITENPYFIDPDEWLRKNAPQFLY